MTSRYKYTYEWGHGLRSLIRHMTVRSTETKKVVFSLDTGIVVYDITGKEPSVRMHPIPIQYIAAIVAEIEREGKRLREVTNG